MNCDFWVLMSSSEESAFLEGCSKQGAGVDDSS